MAGPGVFEPQCGDLTFYGGPVILAKPWLFSSHWLSADSKGNWRINLALDKIEISGWLAGAAKRPGALWDRLGWIKKDSHCSGHSHGLFLLHPFVVSTSSTFLRGCNSVARTLNDITVGDFNVCVAHFTDPPPPLPYQQHQQVFPLACKRAITQQARLNDDCIVWVLVYYGFNKFLWTNYLCQCVFNF